MHFCILTPKHSSRTISPLSHQNWNELCYHMTPFMEMSHFTITNEMSEEARQIPPATQDVTSLQSPSQHPYTESLDGFPTRLVALHSEMQREASQNTVAVRFQRTVWKQLRRYAKNCRNPPIDWSNVSMSLEHTTRSEFQRKDQIRLCTRNTPRSASPHKSRLWSVQLTLSHWPPSLLFGFWYRTPARNTHADLAKFNSSHFTHK